MPLASLLTRKIVKLFHGSPKDFDSFDPEFAKETAFGKGFSFTPDEKIAKNYADLSPKEIKKLWGEKYVKDALERKKDGTPVLYAVEANIDDSELLLARKNFNSQDKSVQAKINKLIKDEKINKDNLDLDKPKFWRQLIKESGKSSDKLFPKYKIKAILKDATDSKLKQVGGDLEYTVFDPKSLKIVDKVFLKKEGKEMQKRESKAAGGGKKASILNKDYTSGKDFPDLTGDGKVTEADVLKGRGVFAEGGDVDSFRMMYEAFKKEMAAAKDAEEKAMIQERFQEQTQNVDEETKREVYKSMDRKREADGGSMLVPPEMPVDTYTPEEQANAEKEQLPDSEMEDNYMDFVLDESLQADEQEYLMNALEADPKLNSIIDKIIMTASEFSGAGEVEGPGTGVSDSIPARLSDGEFVITEKATDQIGADNLQRMMDDAERMADGGEARYGYQMGGMLANPMAMKQDDPELMEDPLQQTEEEINKSMMQANRIPSLMGAYR